MADKSIGDLNFAPGTVDDGNTLFAVQQNGTAYKLSGHEFILAMTAVLDGHGGIQTITKTGTSGLVDTYTITYADQTTSTFTVDNAKSITSITQYWAVNNSPSTVPNSWSTTRQTMTASNRYLWSYMSIAYNSGSPTTTTKSVVGVYGDTGPAWYVWIRYAGVRPTRDADIGTEPDDWIGVYSGTAATAPTSYTSYQWFQIKGETGATGATGASIATVTRTSGDGSPGTYDTYTITLDNSVVAGTIQVYNGLNGSGAVGSVNNVNPDGTGNVALTATNIPTTGSTVQADLTSLNQGLAGKQAAITANGMLKGNGSAVSAATKGTDYGAKSFTVTLTTAGWSSNAQTVSNSNFVTSGYAYIVSPASASFAAYAEAQIYADDVTTSGRMTFHCTDVPSAALTVNVTRVVSA